MMLQPHEWLLPEHKPKLDREWFVQLKELEHDWSPLWWMQVDYQESQKQQRLFLEGAARNPALVYNRYSHEDLDRRQAQYQDFLGRLTRRESNELVRHVYQDVIQERMDTLDLLRESLGTDSLAFSQRSQVLFGKPRVDVFHRLLNNLAAVADLQKVLPLSPTLEKTRETAHHSTAVLLKDRLRFFTDLVTEDSDYGAEEIAEVLRASLQLLGLLDWRVEIHSEAYAVVAGIRSKQVTIPAWRRATGDQLRGLLVHEIGTHVLRGINGERSPLLLLAYGLSGYVQGEEGLAAWKGNLVRRKRSQFVNSMQYLAISLALGLDGQLRDFREVFEILRRIYLVLRTSSLHRAAWSVGAETAEEQAWRICLRVFRGTDGKTRGACFTRDVLYQHGFEGIKEVLKQRPSEAARWDYGKYDPSNPAHVEVLDALGLG